MARYDCRHLTAASLPERPIQDGSTSGLLLVRTAWHDPAPPMTAPLEGPATPDRLYSIVAARQHPSLDAASADWTATLAALTATWGAPDRADTLDGLRADARLARVRAEWTYDDLDVSLQLTRFDRDWKITETLTLPALAATLPDRGGPSAHGGGEHRNPHVAEPTPKEGT
jgi:hypothetical protein